MRKQSDLKSSSIMKNQDRRKAILKFVLVLIFILIFHNTEGIAGKRPYSNDSPWNLKIGPNPVYDPQTDLLVTALEGIFGSNAKSYANPIYKISDDITPKSVHISGVFSEVSDNGTLLTKQKGGTVLIPIPEEACPAEGTDSQIVIWKLQTGDEWKLWQGKKQVDGTWTAVNGYHYNTNWNGVPPEGFTSRGGGFTNLAGVIRPWEIQEGRIEHAVAFSYDYPSPDHIFPAHYSDGRGTNPPDMPMGTRLQLDPSLSDQDFNRWGLDRAGIVIAKALQEYGMIVINSSGHPKIGVEYEGTANWNGLIDKYTVRNIPYSAFKVLSLSTPERPSVPTGLTITSKDRRIDLKWNVSEWATRYCVKRRTNNDSNYTVITHWETTTAYSDTNVVNGTEYYYVVAAVNHNGMSEHSIEVNTTPQKTSVLMHKKRPYSDDSPWNLEIGSNPIYDDRSDQYITSLEGVFGSDPTQYSKPVYEVDNGTSVKTVTLSNYFSEVTDNNSRLVRTRSVTVSVPIPDGAKSSKGTDGQIIIWNPETGDEWGFWQAHENDDGTWSAVNGYHYNTQWNGVPPTGFMSRGAGITYFAGLIRPWEIDQGRIEHALAFSYDYPSANYIYPATKSDGKGSLTDDLPEGARLQLDPELTEEDFDRWGLSPAGKIIAKALQEYGMIVVDCAGHPKISAEYEGTAHWNGIIEHKTPKNIPYSAFKVLSLSIPTRPPVPSGFIAVSEAGQVTLRWNRAAWATRYQVKTRTVDDSCYTDIATWITDTTYTDLNVRNNRTYFYVVTSVNYNGVSEPSKEVSAVPGSLSVRSKESGSSFIPKMHRLEQNYPNPFNGITSIFYTLVSKTNVDLSIYNVEGKKIKEYIFGQQGAGRYSITWDGTDSEGILTSSGMYICRLKTDYFSQMRKMCLVK